MKQVREGRFRGSERRESGHLGLARLQLPVDRQDVEDLAQLHVLHVRDGAGASRNDLLKGFPALLLFIPLELPSKSLFKRPLWKPFYTKSGLKTSFKAFKSL